MLQLSVFLQDFGVCLWGIFAHSSRRAFVRSDTVVGGDDLAHCLSSSSSLRCSVQALPLWTLVHPGTEKGLHQTVPTKLSKMSWNAEALQFSFTGTKEPRNNP